MPGNLPLKFNGLLKLRLPLQKLQIPILAKLQKLHLHFRLHLQPNSPRLPANNHNDPNETGLHPAAILLAGPADLGQRHLSFQRHEQWQRADCLHKHVCLRCVPEVQLAFRLPHCLEDQLVALAGAGLDRAGVPLDPPLPPPGLPRATKIRRPLPRALPAGPPIPVPLPAIRSLLPVPSLPAPGPLPQAVPANRRLEHALFQCQPPAARGLGQVCAEDWHFGGCRGHAGRYCGRVGWVCRGRACEVEGSVEADDQAVPGLLPGRLQGQLQLLVHPAGPLHPHPKIPLLLLGPVHRQLHSQPALPDPAGLAPGLDSAQAVLVRGPC